MSKIKPLQSKNSGSALVMVLIVVVLLSVMGTGLLDLGRHSRVFAARNVTEISARCAADAGLTRAVFEMNEQLKVEPWDDSTLPLGADVTLPNSYAVFSYTVTGDVGSGYIIESTGNAGQAVKTVNCALRLQGPFESAIATQQAIVLKDGTLVDGYNSLDPEDSDVGVKIGTNDTASDSIVLNFGVNINGSVFVGVGGDTEDVIKDLGATVTGGEYILCEELSFPSVTAPVLPDMGADIETKGQTLTIGPADSGKYGDVELKRDANPGILEVAGGDVVLYVTGDITLGQDCEIKIKEGASLVLYLDGDLDVRNNAGINNENSPTNFKLYGTSEGSQTLDIKAKGDFYGAVYAPNATVTIMSGGDVYGSITAKNFELKSGGNFYYDKALRNVDLDDDVVRFVVKQWGEE